MRHGNNAVQQPRLRTLASIFISIALVTSVCAAQSSDHAKPRPVQVAAISAPPLLTAQEPENQKKGAPDIAQFMPLLQELGKLQEKMQREIQFPALRTQSRLLSQLPASTEVFVALPNYGDVLHQAIQIFQREVKENQTLREQWQSFPMGPMVEDGLDKVYQLSQFLGNEIVVAAEIKPKGGSFAVLAEIKKPGLNAYLQGLLKQFGGAGAAPIRILTPQTLLTAKPSKQPVMLVRPDLLVITDELATLKRFNAQLARPTGKLAPTPFGQRLAESYQNGAGTLFAADLGHLVGLMPTKSKKDLATFQQTGFSDVKFLVGEHKETSPGQTLNTLEISFNGPRRGIASWLAAPGPIGSLDFVSANAGLASSMVIKSPSQMMDDILAIAKASDPNSEATIAQGEAMMNLKIKDDLLNKIGKDVTIALDGPFAGKDSMPPWKVVLQVTDANGLQQTLQKLLTAAGAFMPGPQAPSLDQKTEGGQTFYTLHISTGPKPVEVNYAFADGYMVLGPTRELVSEAIQTHRDGSSLARSGSFQSLKPQDRRGDASAVWYQNLAPMLIPLLKQLSPQMAPMLEGVAGQGKPSASFTYADQDAVRVLSNSGGTELVGALIGAAVAIPNLMKSRMAANEAGAAATMRTLITVQITYANTYPEQGYSRDLASLGGGAHCTPTKAHACLTDDMLGCPAGTSGRWCTKNNYRYTTVATCKAGVCDEFVVIGTPDNPSAGAKSFCATSDAVVRSQTGPPLTEPITAAECQTWAPL